MEAVHSLDDGINLLRNDRTNGARVLATNALKILRVVIENQDASKLQPSQLWQDCRHASYKLTLARPSMASTITSALTNALKAVREAWNERLGLQWHLSENTAAIQKLALRALDEQISQRDQNSEKLADEFLGYISSLSALEYGHVRVLTISSSSTLHLCLHRAITTLPKTKFTISVLESRPNMEGASFATRLCNEFQESIKEERVKVVVAPDSHVCLLAREVDVLLLGADRVSGDGDVSNKMGSLSAAIAVKILSDGFVVVVTETDKIARPGRTNEHEEEDNMSSEVYESWPEDAQVAVCAVEGSGLQVRNVYFEWVLSSYIDTYVTEEGIFNSGLIKDLSEQKGRLEDQLFDHSIKSLA